MLVTSLAEFPRELRGCAVSIGNFDGVHRGHAALVGALIAEAKTRGVPSVVLTFDPHPLTLLRPSAAPRPITWTQRKLAILEQLGVVATVVIATNLEFLQLTANEFFDRVVLQTLQASALVEGPNFYFGRGREGTIDFLREKCQQSRIGLQVIQPSQHEGELISSSRVRELILTGRVGVANQWLVRPFRLRGIVVEGAQRGRTIGFPTANLEQIQTVIPAEGVYAARAYTQGCEYPAAVNIGPNPTFNEQAFKVEAHLIGFTGDLYGEPLELEFIDRLRTVQTFSSVVELRNQLHRDIAEVSEICACGGFSSS